MQIKTQDGTYNVGSQGVAGAGLGLGIAGTTLGLLGNGLNGLFGARTSNVSECHDTRKIASLESELAREKAERYADSVSIATFKESQIADDKLASRIAILENFAHNIDKQVAVDKQAVQDNFAFLNNEIHNTKKEIMCYVNATFVPGKLVMPLDNICPEAMQRYNSWTAPTTTTGA